MASQEEVRLYSSLKEREVFDIQSDLYSIFVATENLERAYIRDLVGADDYLQALFPSLVNSLGTLKLVPSLSASSRPVYLLWALHLMSMIS
jgi:hypothetical protein